MKKIKITSAEVEEFKQLTESAYRIMERYKNSEASLDVTVLELVAIARAQDHILDYSTGYHGFFDKEMFEEHVRSNIEAYNNGDTYMLSYASSGSLLRQFDLDNIIEHLEIVEG